MRVLVLFSGTGSIEKVYDREQHEIRTLDLDKKFNPYYNVDILEWYYESVFEDWVPDYIHASPVCSQFSNLKHFSNHTRSELGTNLLTRTLEIIEYVKTLNPNLKYTIENPKGQMRKLDIMTPYQRITTSYCKYGFPYQKDTDFWFGGFDLVLNDRCGKNNRCDGFETYGCHRVRLGLSKKKPGDTSGFQPTNENQIGDAEYFRQLKKDFPERYGGFSNTYFRYRIPEGLCEQIRDCVLAD